MCAISRQSFDAVFYGEVDSKTPKMDHLLFDKETQLPSEDVPVFGVVKYDHGDWKTFPKRCGYTVQSLRIAAFPLPTEKSSFNQEQKAGQLRALSVIQEWIFFGLLCEWSIMMGCIMFRHEFIMEKDGRQFVCTYKLHELLEKVVWCQTASIFQLSRQHVQDSIPTYSDGAIFTIAARRFLRDGQKLSLPDRLSIYRMLVANHKTLTTVKRATSLVSTAYTVLFDPKHKHEFKERITDDVVHFWLSAFSVLDMLNGTSRALDTSTLSYNFPLECLPDFLIERARSAGLCPSKLKSGIVDNPAGVYVASSTRRSSVRDHISCTRDRCTLVKDTSILPRHRYPCPGNCQEVGIGKKGYSKAIRSVQNGGYPLCKIRAGRNGKLSIEVIEHAGPDRPYIAFSHVWYVGLSRPTDRSEILVSALFNYCASSIG